MSYTDEQLLSISGIQHFVFCRRQWALIHIEQQWEENLLTVSGNIMHKNAHDNSFSEKRNNVIISRGMSITSHELGLTGVCDIVEFHRSDDGALIHGYDGLYKIIPVEYKLGEPKETDSDILQVAAQAYCLENMFCTTVEELDIYYGKTRHRIKIPFDDELRQRLLDIVNEMHMLYDRRYTPTVKKGKQCNACSLKEICLPKLSKSESVAKYIRRNIEEISNEKVT
ncbi:MAG: CRISPR-associated protein Cas4 [Ruminococcus sp.]|nr:CRISPR-associated protein Cas4 [Ruminococcus sp.]